MREKAARLVYLTLTLLAVLTALGSPKGWMPGRAADGRISLTLCASVGPPPPALRTAEASVTPHPHADHHAAGGATMAHPADHQHAPAHAAREEQAQSSESDDDGSKHDHKRPHSNATEVCAWAGQHAGPPAQAPPPLESSSAEALTTIAQWSLHAAPLLQRLAPPPPATAPPLKV